MEDFVYNSARGKLMVGERDGGVWITVERGSGEVERVRLGVTVARALGEWLGAAVERLGREASPAQVLQAGAEALGALERGEFEPKTSREFWEAGFDVGSDRCEWCARDEWVAIHDPEVGEIEVYVSGDGGCFDGGAAKVSVGAGTVVRL